MADNEKETDKFPEEEKPAKPEKLEDENLEQINGGGAFSDVTKIVTGVVKAVLPTTI